MQALIQPLGLFRKRALAIQQLSQDYLYKQVSEVLPAGQPAWERSTVYSRQNVPC